MRIRMLADFSYPIDDAGRERTLPRGRIFDEPDAIADLAIAKRKAVVFKPEIGGDAIEETDEVVPTPATPSTVAPATKPKRTA